jgi:hypothetical protein
MTGTRGKLAAVVLAAVTAAGLAACGQSAQAATCDRADGVSAAVDNLKDVNLAGENGLVALQDAMAGVKTQLEAMRADIRADQQPQVDAVKAAVEQVRSSLAGVKANPTSQGLVEVRANLQTLGAAVGQLRLTVGAGC